MNIRLLFIFFTFSIYSFTLLPGDDDKRFPKVLTDDNSKFTTVGNIGITVTNFGTYGNGFGSFWDANQPSCEFPRGSRIEHLFDGGLWIGGYQADGSQVAGISLL